MSSRNRVCRHPHFRRCCRRQLSLPHNSEHCIIRGPGGLKEESEVPKALNTSRQLLTWRTLEKCIWEKGKEGPSFYQHAVHVYLFNKLYYTAVARGKYDTLAWNRFATLRLRCSTAMTPRCSTHPCTYFCQVFRRRGHAAERRACGLVGLVPLTLTPNGDGRRTSSCAWIPQKTSRRMCHS